MTEDKYVPKAFADIKGGVIQSNDWWTPPEIFKALDMKFDLDVASPIGGVDYIPCTNYYSEQQDGLATDWFGTVWCNPPYGRDTYKWLEKFIKHNNGIALVFARTDTKWFHELVIKADAIVFTKGRIKFWKAGQDIGAYSASGSLFVACGEISKQAIKNSNLGYYIDLENL